MGISDILLTVSLFGLSFVLIITIFLALLYLEMRDTSRNIIDVTEELGEIKQTVSNAITYIPNYLQTLPARKTRSKRTEVKEQLPLGYDIMDKLGMGSVAANNPQMAAYVEGMAQQIFGKVMEKVNTNISGIVEGAVKAGAETITDTVSE